MPAPQVILREIDLTTRVPGFPGVYAGIVIQAPKGPIDEARLCDTDTTLLKTYTPEQKIKVEYDAAFYSALAALEQTDKLWVKRVVGDNYLFGGADIAKDGTVGVTDSWSTGMADPSTYDFSGHPNMILAFYGINPGVWNNDVGFKIWIPREVETPDAATDVDPVLNQIQVTQFFETGEPVRLNISEGGTIPPGLADKGVYYTKKVSATKVSLSLTPDGDIEDITDVGSGTLTITPLKTIKEPNAFRIEIYLSSNTSAPVESYEVCRTPGKKNGYGRNMYIETMLASSEYFNVMDNHLEDETLYPKAVPIMCYLGGGDDGDSVTDGKMILAVQDAFENPDKYPLTILMDGGYAVPAYQRTLWSICEARHDSVAILSCPFELEDVPDYLNLVVDYVKNSLHAGTSFAAIYSPHVYIYDKDNDREIYVAPDGYAAAAISATAMNYELWFPVGGFKRGKIEVQDVRRSYSSAERDYLYDNSINPLRFVPGKGIYIWGQKTLYGIPSDLDRLNVRLLLVVIEPAVTAYLEDFEFEFNDDPTRSILKSKLDSYMNDVRARRGVSGFRTVCDKTNNSTEDIQNHRLNVDLFIKPNLSVEYIPFTVILTPQGMSFDLAAQALRVS